VKLIFKNSFLKDAQRLKERALALRVKDTIEAIERAENLSEIANLKPLTGFTGYYRVRVGDYRVGLRVDGDTIVLIRLLHRKEIYRFFP
jgi:mRNA interferase RelE/StbE